MSPQGMHSDVYGGGVEMPRYECHKKVWALKIKSINLHAPTAEDLQLILDGGPEPEGAIIVPDEAGYGAFLVSREYVLKHEPQPGGYLVIYEDGYLSFSPAKAFEDGYRRLAA